MFNKKILLVTIIIFILIILGIIFFVFLRQSPNSQTSRSRFLSEAKGTIVIDTSLNFEPEDKLSLEIKAPDLIKRTFSSLGGEIKRSEFPYTIEFYSNQPFKISLEASYQFKFNDYQIFKVEKDILPKTQNIILINQMSPRCRHDYCRPLCSAKKSKTNSRIKGAVVSAQTGQPLPWAEVWLSRTEKNQYGEKQSWGESFFCLTAADGKFELDVEPDSREYFISIIRDNYLDYIHQTPQGEIVFKAVNKGETWNVGQIKLSKAGAFQTYLEGNFQLKYRSEAEKVVGLNLLKIYKKDIEKVGQHLQLTPPFQQFVLQCAESFELERAGQIFENIVFIKCAPPLSLTDHEQIFDGLLKHELMHMYVGKHILPIWFQEGLAFYEEAALNYQEGQAGAEPPPECTLKNKSDSRVRNRCIFEYSFTDVNHPAEYSSAGCFYSALRKGDNAFLQKLLIVLDQKLSQKMSAALPSRSSDKSEERRPEGPAPRQTKPSAEPRGAGGSSGLTLYEFLQALRQVSGLAKEDFVQLLTENYGCQEKKEELLISL